MAVEKIGVLQDTFEKYPAFEPFLTISSPSFDVLIGGTSRGPLLSKA